ncbi:tetratricopeptide repeat protein [Paraliomyxa miuraensis]|uniref:tetratricopeptide repeat protein n=1 Tax=Paraliomyxa miuraensis TaxID=376150 RepID=UPI002252B8D8|nr:tetratricopeptide repeat protein [Paraliomyxa miuraensis]MCX4243405.1 tetratricopeptide repeat protein [Paraliomyxa miuraensis]
MEAARRAAQAPVPWDDLRQRRVLDRVQASVAARAEVRRRRRLGSVLAGVSAAAAAVLLSIAWPSDPVEEPIAVASSAAPDAVSVVPLPSIPYATWPQLRLPDDSVAELRFDARVDVDVQRDDLVRLLQHRGEVRYEVAPDRSRSFVVDAAGVEVRVVGTVFTVTLDESLDGRPQRVEIAVERGLVEVDSGARVAELGPGDHLSVDVNEHVAARALADDEPERPSRAARPSVSTSGSTGPSVDALLSKADAARASGDLPAAAAALSELVRRYSSDPRAYSAYFQLGKVERARGRHAAAAAAFDKCWKRAPQGPLAEDASAEAAVSWKAAGRADRARAAAEAYLARHRAGTHQDRMRALLAELP